MGTSGTGKCIFLYDQDTDRQVIMIPPFDLDGALPSGEHSLPDTFCSLNRDMELNWNRHPFIYQIIKQSQPELE